MRFPYHKLQKKKKKKNHLARKALTDFVDRLQAPPAMPSTERKTTAYDRNFEQLLMDEGFDLAATRFV